MSAHVHKMDLLDVGPPKEYVCAIPGCDHRESVEMAPVNFPVAPRSLQPTSNPPVPEPPPPTPQPPPIPNPPPRPSGPRGSSPQREL